MTQATYYSDIWDEEMEKESSGYDIVDFFYEFFDISEDADPMIKMAEIMDEDTFLDLLCDIEDHMEIEFEFNDVMSMCDGSLTNAIEKVAKISSAEERAKMKAYYVQNKAMLARKAKKRKRRQKMGLARKKTRTGTAGGGFGFILSASGGPSIKSSGSSVGSGSISSGMPSFNPNRQPSSSYSSSHLSRF